jgi:hypothetical protein
MPPFSSAGELRNDGAASQVMEWDRLPQAWLARPDTGAKSRLIDLSHAEQPQDLALELAQLGREDHGRSPADS